MGQSDRREILVTMWQWRHWLYLLMVGLTTYTQAIKCYVDNQGIPVEEAGGIIAEFKEFDCSLGEGTHRNCLKRIAESDGQMLIYRNCGLLEEKTGCEIDAANVTRCYCTSDFCNSSPFLFPSLIQYMLISLLQISLYLPSTCLVTTL